MTTARRKIGRLVIEALQPPEDIEDLIRRLNGTATFVLASTVALALQDDEGLKCAGTGTLFEVAGRYFVITAQHVCDVDLATLFIPAHENFDDRVVCENFEVTLPKGRQDIDVAAIELSDTTVYRLLTKDYKFLKLDRIDFRGPSERSIITGYLERRYPPSGTGIIRSTTVLCDRIDAPSGVMPPAEKDLDFFYRYTRTAYRVEGEGTLVEEDAPELPGISGASAWEMLRVVDGIWRPEKSLYVTGIEVAYAFGRYARVQSWWAVARLLSMKSREIAKRFSEKTGLTIDALTADTGIQPPGAT